MRLGYKTEDKKKKSVTRKHKKMRLGFPTTPISKPKPRAKRKRPKVIIHSKRLGFHTLHRLPPKKPAISKPKPKLKPKLIKSTVKISRDRLNILFMTANTSNMVTYNLFYHQEKAIATAASCVWAGLGYPKRYVKEPLHKTVSRIYGRNLPDWVIMSPFTPPEGIRWINFKAPKRRDYKIAAFTTDIHTMLPRYYWKRLGGYAGPEKYVKMLNAAGFDAVFMLYSYLKMRWTKRLKNEPIAHDYYWKNLRAKIFQVPPSVNPKIFKPTKQRKLYDVASLGTTKPRNIYPLRHSIWRGLREMSMKCTPARIGWDCVGKRSGWRFILRQSPPGFTPSRSITKLYKQGYAVGERYVNILARSRILIFGTSVYKYPLVKFFEGMACKTLVMADRPFTAKKLHLIPGYNFVEINMKNWKEKLRYYLTHEKERARIAERGYQTFLKHHTCNVRARELIKFMEANK